MDADAEYTWIPHAPFLQRQSLAARRLDQRRNPPLADLRDLWPEVKILALEINIVAPAFGKPLVYCRLPETNLTVRPLTEVS